MAANFDEDDDESIARDAPEDVVRRAILRLEDRIEQLTASLESCRKVMLASRIAIGVGAVLLVAMAIGVVGDPLAMIAGFALVIGGVVLLGSNSSTAQQAGAAVRAAEAERAALIGRIDLRVVGGSAAAGAGGVAGAAGGGALADWPPPDAPRPTLH